jgi:hypothetical protein
MQWLSVVPAVFGMWRKRGTIWRDGISGATDRRGQIIGSSIQKNGNRMGESAINYLDAKD